MIHSYAPICLLPLPAYIHTINESLMNSVIIPYENILTLHYLVQQLVVHILQ